MFYSIIFAVCLLNHVKADKPMINLMPDMAAKALPAAMNCVAEIGVENDNLAKFMKSEILNNEQHHKFLHCTFNKIGLLEDSGLINVDETIKAFPESYANDMRKVFEECNQIAESAGSPSDKVGKLYVCYIEKSPVLLRF